MTFVMVLPYDTDDESFVRGFEAGRLWTLMQECPEKLPGMLFRASNSEMVMRMIESRELKLKAKFTDDENWMTFDDA
jgi:hypothetical protein